MTKNFLIALGFIACLHTSAQVPMKFNYQAVARTPNGSAMASQSIGVRIVLTDGPGGTAQYMEHHTVTTNPYGVFSLQVGSGDVDMGAMNTVPWNSGNVWIKVEVDPTGGTNYTVLGFAQLLSVPYAMVAGNALNGGGGGGSNVQSINDLNDVTTTGVTNGQVLSWNGMQWIPTSLNLTNTDNQTLSLAGNMLSITGGNSITLPSGGGTQTLSLSGSTLSISGGNSVTIPTAGGSTYTAGSGINIIGNTINATDNSNTNELQTLSLSGNTLSISQGNSITLPTNSQSLTLTGNTLSISGGNSVTLPSSTAPMLSLSGSTLSISGGNSVTLPSGGGGATALSQLTDVNTTGAQAGHVLKYDGVHWVPMPDNTTGGAATSLWNTNGNNIYNYNSGNVGIGCSNPTAMLHVKNITPTNASNMVSVENSGDGYNIYSNKTGTAEAVYLVKDNPSSGTPNVYATNNGSGNTMDVFATGSGYAGNFRCGPSGIGALYAKTTSSGYAGTFDGDVTGGGIKASTASNGYAGEFNGKTKIAYASYANSAPQLLLYETSTNGAARLCFQNASGGTNWNINGLTNGTAANAKMSFYHSSGMEVMTLTGDGNVGIANTAPAARLHVIGSTSYMGNVVKIENNNGTSVYPTMVITSDGSGELINASKTGVGYGINVQKTGSLSSSAAIYGGNAGTNGEGVRGSVFGAGGYGVYGNAAGSGTNSFTGVYGYGSGSNGVDYGIYGQQGAGSNDYAGYFNGNVGYTGTLLSTSDARLKQNIRTYTGGLSAVLQLKPKTYEYKQTGDLAKIKSPEGTQIGLLAQDIEQVLPGLIKETTFNSIEKKDGESEPATVSVPYKGVNYIGMIPVLVNAIQEQQQQIELLKKEIEELKKK